MGIRVAPTLSWLKASSPFALAALVLAIGVAGAVLISGQPSQLKISFALLAGFVVASLFARHRKRTTSARVAHLESELAAAEKRVLAASEAKSDFVATVSHEIRTPMNGLIGFTELALAGDLDDEMRANLEMLAESGRAMLALLNDLLDSAKIDAGRMEAKFEPIDIGQKLRSSISMMSPIAAHKGIALDIDIDADLPAWVEGDPARLRQIMLNLVGNALKFTEQGGISVTAFPANDGQTYSISVADTGIGIPQDKLGEIFDKFTQADATIDRRFGGTGLGLPICAQLADLLGGSISVESELGKGSIFTLTLPLVKTAKPRRRKEDCAADAAGSFAESQARILLVEDNTINQRVSIAMLHRLGLEAELAGSGEMAVELVLAARDSGRPFDLVLMDQRLPGMDGLETARAIRNSGINVVTLPIIAVTANASEEDKAACLAAGMQAHLAKPYGLDEIAAVLGNWLEKNNASPKAVERRTPSASLVKNFSERKEKALRTIDASVRNGSLESRSLEELANQLHQIAGVAAFFGEVDLGASCSELDHRLRNEPGLIEANDFEEICALLRA